MARESGGANDMHPLGCGGAQTEKTGKTCYSQLSGILKLTRACLELQFVIGEERSGASCYY